MKINFGGYSVYFSLRNWVTPTPEIGSSVAPLTGLVNTTSVPRPVHRPFTAGLFTPNNLTVLGNWFLGTIVAQKRTTKVSFLLVGVEGSFVVPQHNRALSTSQLSHLLAPLQPGLLGLLPLLGLPLCASLLCLKTFLLFETCCLSRPFYNFLVILQALPKERFGHPISDVLKNSPRLNL